MSVQGRKADLETAPVFRVSSSEEKPDFEATIMPTKASRLSAIRNAGGDRSPRRQAIGAEGDEHDGSSTVVDGGLAF